MLVAFCSREHQVAFWPSHQLFCKTVNKLLREDGTAKSIYQIKRYQNNKSGMDQLQYTVSNLANALGHELGREPTFEEKMVSLI